MTSSALPVPAVGPAETCGGPGARWTITTTTGLKVTGYLPAWAAEDPSEAGVLVEQLGARLSDISHHAAFRDQFIDADDGRGQQILSGSIDCNPYAEDPEPRVPTAAVNVTSVCRVGDLDPDGLAKFSAQLRAAREWPRPTTAGASRTGGDLGVPGRSRLDDDRPARAVA
ncbi:DUF6907 domain-containing protein [Streptomyces sp. NBC_00448]|uniref:DUF6907 domain-containing protein n=1 Tax=Streptomyces sp. NBC_00448 TaxID=2903652 RepID=UPI002E226465